MSMRTFYIVISVAFIMSGCATLPKWTPLHEAVAVGEVEKVKTMIASGIDIDREGSKPGTSGNVITDYRTPLGMAIEKGDSNLVDILLNAGADPAFGLKEAVLFNRIDELDRCLKLTEKKYGNSWAKQYRSEKESGDLYALYRRHVDRAISTAVWKGDTRSLDVFIDNGLDINKGLVCSELFSYNLKTYVNNTDYIDRFPARDFQYIGGVSRVIYIAIATNNIDMVKYLIEKGAKTNVYSTPVFHFQGWNPYYQMTMGPLEWAVFLRNEEIVCLLLEHEANPNISGVKVQPGTRSALALSMGVARVTGPQFIHIFSEDIERSKRMFNALVAHGANLDAPALGKDWTIREMAKELGYLQNDDSSSKSEK